MKRFGAWAAICAAGIVVALSAPAVGRALPPGCNGAAAFQDRSIVRCWGRWSGYDDDYCPPDWYGSSGFCRRGWRTACWYPDVGESCYDPCGAYWYPNAGPSCWNPYGGYWRPDAGVSYYYDPSAVNDPPDPPTNPNVVTIQMHVPDNAQVWIEGNVTSQTGADREYVSPSLTPGHDYVYHVRVKWDANNKTEESTRDVPVHVGDRINLRFGQ